MEIVVSNKASQPLYEQIASQIKAAIISGELQAGEAIPSVRSLAKSLQIRKHPPLCRKTVLLKRPPGKAAMYRRKTRTSIWRNSKKG